jgi:hypothetical protein
MADLTLHGRTVRTVFDLLGKDENDLTYSLGWSLAQSDSLVKCVLAEVFPGEAAGDAQAVRLQEFTPGGGFTDIELETNRMAVIASQRLEVKLVARSECRGDQGSFWRISAISSRLKARTVVVRKFPCEPAARRKAVPVASSGNSATVTMSCGPVVQ